MSNDTPNMNDPLAFLRNMWSGMGASMPGMVTPTFDVDELDKRIKDMKAVEGWLRMKQPPPRRMPRSTRKMGHFPAPRCGPGR